MERKDFTGFMQVLRVAGGGCTAGRQGGVLTWTGERNKKMRWGKKIGKSNKGPFITGHLNDRLI